LRGERQALALQRDRHPAARGDMAGVGEQAVGDIDRGRGEPAQREPQRDPRRRLREHPRRLVARAARQELSQAQRRGARMAADPDLVARARAIAAQREPGRHAAVDLDGDAERSARGVAADQRDMVAPRERGKAAAEPGEPGLIGLGQGQREREPQRARTHRGQVAEVDRQRAVADLLRAAGGGKMHAGDQRVDGDREILARQASAGSRRRHRCRARRPRPRAARSPSESK
jgi:hypothetical protein